MLMGVNVDRDRFYITAAWVCSAISRTLSAGGNALSFPRAVATARSAFGYGNYEEL